MPEPSLTGQIANLFFPSANLGAASVGNVGAGTSVQKIFARFSCGERNPDAPYVSYITKVKCARISWINPVGVKHLSLVPSSSLVRTFGFHPKDSVSSNLPGTIIGKDLDVGFPYRFAKAAGFTRSPVGSNPTFSFVMCI